MASQAQVCRAMEKEMHPWDSTLHMEHAMHAICWGCLWLVWCSVLIALHGVCRWQLQQQPGWLVCKVGLHGHCASEEAACCPCEGHGVLYIRALHHASVCSTRLRAVPPLTGMAARGMGGLACCRVAWNTQAGLTMSADRCGRKGRA